MKYLCSILLLFISCSSFSQSVIWAPAGAEWHYSITPYQEPAFLHVWYQSDTSIDGQPCKLLREHWRSWSFSNGQAFSSYYNRYSYESNGIVYEYTFIPGSSTTGAWDTLYNFNALPGQSWHFHELGWNEKITVQDTGRTQVNGQVLQWYTAKYSYGGTEHPLVDTVYERIGSVVVSHPYRSLFLISDPGIAGFCNYSDNTFPDWIRSDSACRSMPTSRPDLVSALQLTAYPNPASDILIIRFQNQTTAPVYLKLFDVFGRRVMQQVVAAPEPVLEVSLTGLPAGVYMLQVKQQERSKTLRIVRQ